MLPDMKFMKNLPTEALVKSNLTEAIKPQGSVFSATSNSLLFRDDENADQKDTPDVYKYLATGDLATEVSAKFAATLSSVRGRISSARVSMEYNQKEKAVQSLTSALSEIKQGIGSILSETEGADLDWQKAMFVSMLQDLQNTARSSFQSVSNITVSNTPKTLETPDSTESLSLNGAVLTPQSMAGEINNLQLSNHSVRA